MNTKDLSDEANEEWEAMARAEGGREAERAVARAAAEAEAATVAATGVAREEVMAAAEMAVARAEAATEEVARAVACLLGRRAVWLVSLQYWVSALRMHSMLRSAKHANRTVRRRTMEVKECN